jgi:hypothetical protein
VSARLWFSGLVPERGIARHCLANPVEILFFDASGVQLNSGRIAEAIQQYEEALRCAAAAGAAAVVNAIRTQLEEYRAAGDLRQPLAMLARLQSDAFCQTVARWLG